MKIAMRKNIFVLFAVMGGVIIVGLTIFLITALHIIKLFFGLFIDRKKSGKPTKFYQYSEDIQVNNESKRRVTKTIDAEVVTAETKSE
jgi:hypothetical protein